MKKIFSLITVCLLAMQFVAQNYCASAAFGYGKSATGGGNASPTLVSDLSGLKAISKAKNKVFIITKSITMTSMVTLQDMSNVTILALPGVTLTNLQQNSTSSGILYIKRTDNLIMRNITFVGPGAYDCDGNDNLCFEKVTNAWVDHCDFQDGCDGNFDNKSTTDNVTVSWCRFRYLKEPKAGGSGGAADHRFTNLLGSSSSDKPSDGTYNMTWAYCWWDEGCKERMLRCRNASLHFLNCYWNSSVANYYIGPENADCYIEGCTFEGAPKTAKIFYQNYGGTNGAKFVNCTATKGLPSNVNNRTVVTPTYTYTALSAANAKTMVTNSSCGAGATLVVTTAGAISSSCDSGVTYYTVTWNANGGSSSLSSSQVQSGSAIGTLPTATRSGYTFNGWFTQTSGGSQISASTTVSGNITYYAQYTEDSGSGGGDPITSDLTWNFSDSKFTSLDSTTIANNGAVVDGLTIASGIAYDKNNKTIDGHSFTYRMKTGGTGSSSAKHFRFSVTGACIIEVYLISSSTKIGNERTLNVYAGSYSGDPITTMEAGLTAAKATFNYTGSATTIYLGSASGGINIYAINVIYSGSGGGEQPVETVTLSYDENGGSGEIADQTVNAGTAVTVKANSFTAPTGYSFKEWNDNYKGSGTKYNVGQSVTMNADITIYAVWQPKTYTVTLNAAGGTGGSASVTATFDDAMPNITIPTRSGYTFKGYFSEQNGAGKQYYDQNGSSTNNWTTPNNATLYAYWEETSSTPVVSGDLHFWFFNAADATTNGVINDSEVFSNMVASGSQMAGSITVDGVSYSVTKRTGDNATFGSFTIPESKTGIFYALAVSSAKGDRQLNLVCGSTKYEYSVAGGTDSYKRVESEELPAGTYSIQREGSNNVRLGVVVVKLSDAGSTPPPTPVKYTVTWNAATNGGTCDTETSTVQENTAVGTLPEATRDGYTFNGWFTQATGGEQVTAERIITEDITFFAQFTENQSGGGEEPTGCTLHLWFNSAADRTAAGIEQNATIFTTSLTTSNNAISGFITIDEHNYEVTSRTSNGAPACSFVIPTGSTGTFYMVAVSSGTGTRTITICKDGGAATNTDQVVAGSKTEGSEIVLPNLPAGSYTISASGNIGVGMLGLKLCDAGSQPATKYNVLFWNWNGALLDEREWEYGATPSYSGTPTREDDAQYTYTFNGWDPAIVPVTEPASYIAQFNAQLRKFSAEHVVVSDDQTKGSVTISPQKSEYEYGEQITITATANQGYVFGSWHNEDDEEISANATTTIRVTDSTVTAIFVPNEHIPYIVKHWQQDLVGDGYTEVLADRQNLEGATDDYASATAKAYIGFDAQPYDEPRIAADGSTVVNIYYDRIVYDIKWMIEYEIVRTDHLRYGVMPDYGSTPTKQGDAQYSYTFTGWNPELVTVTYYATYQATFERSTNQYTVTFHANGHASDPQSQTVDYGQTVNAPSSYEFYESGWTFGGWYREPSCQNQWNFSTGVTEDIDLYAKWTANTNTPYEVYYWKQNIKDDGYSILEYDWSKSGTTGQLTAAEARTYTGFTMLPFSQLPIAADGSTVINIYYDRIIYEIQFVADGVVVETDSLRYEDIPEYHGAIPTKPDDEHYTYEFKGWSPHFMAVTQDATYTAWFLEWTKEPTSLNEVETDSRARKLIHDGRLTIIRNGKQYNAQGQLIR